VTVGDFNGDGQPDLVMTESAAFYSTKQNVSVLLNKGDGSFGPASTIDGGIDPVRVAVGDFRGDRKLDLAIADAGWPKGIGAGVSVLLGSGNGTFASPVLYPAGFQPSGVAVADLNGDGKLDLVVTDSNRFIRSLPGSVHVLLGNGDGTFAAPTTMAAGRGAYAVTVAEVNGDGKPDLLVTNSFDNTVSVLLNTGNGFAPAVNYPTGPEPTVVKVADVNGDGKPDLLVSYDGKGPSGTGGVSVLLGKGDGTFAPAKNYPTFVGLNLGLAVADFNGDGKLDIAVPNGSNGTISLLLGNGDGTFAAPTAIPTKDRNLYSVAVADFNGDGAPDLAVVGFSNGAPGNLPDNVSAAEVLFNQGGTVPLLKGPDHPSLFGQPDLFTATVQPVVGGAAVPTGAITFKDGSTVLGPVPLDAAGQAMFTTSTLAVGDHTITAVYQPQVPFFPSASAPLTLTILPPRSTPATFDPLTGTWYLHNSNSGGASDVAPFPYGAPGWLPVVGDWNGDGTATIGVVNPTTATWYLRNSNSGGAPDAGAFAYGLPGWLPVVGDWTHSGHSGIGMFDPSTATWYLRKDPSGGAPDFVFRYGAAGWLPVVGDWDGNGTTTIGVVDPTTMTWYLRNDNSGGAPDAGAFAYGGVGWKPLTGDFGGTGQTGIAVVDPNGVWYLRDRASGGAPDVPPFAYGLGSWTPLAGPYAAVTPSAAPAADRVANADAVPVSDLLASPVHRNQALDSVFVAGG
jgi:hypothetical protein